MFYIFLYIILSPSDIYSSINFFGTGNYLENVHIVIYSPTLITISNQETFSSNSKVLASDLLENLDEMIPRYKMLSAD